MPSAKNTDSIFIRDLVVEMSAGIYDHEKKSKQRVIINIWLDVESNVGKTLSFIDDVVSYEEITSDVCKLALSKHYNLIEELAEKMASMCKKNHRVHRAKIRIEKPDILDNTMSVGIEIVR